MGAEAQEDASGEAEEGGQEVVQRRALPSPDMPSISEIREHKIHICLIVVGAMNAWRHSAENGPTNIRVVMATDERQSYTWTTPS